METFEYALNTIPKKRNYWFCYVDNAFVKIWSYVEKELQIYLSHLNSFSNKIQFTMDTENVGKLAFLDVQVELQSDGNLDIKFIENHPMLTAN